MKELRQVSEMHQQTLTFLESVLTWKFGEKDVANVLLHGLAKELSQNEDQATKG